MFGFDPPAVEGKTWRELGRDDKHAWFRCERCKRMGAAAVNKRPSPCVCEKSNG